MDGIRIPEISMNISVQNWMKNGLFTIKCCSLDIQLSKLKKVISYFFIKNDEIVNEQTKMLELKKHVRRQLL